MTTPRAQPTTVLTTTEPAIANGRPVTPLYWAKSGSSTTAIEGPTHIHFLPDPNPAKSTSTYVNPPGPPNGGPWAARWTVKSLPDPTNYPGGFYWLGVPTSLDGSDRYSNAGTHQWNPDNTSAGGTPAWHSFFPFKPSVTGVNHYLQGGGVVHHPAGVSFNSHFLEHMWMDWGSNHKQPFTWMIAACMSAWPYRGFQQYVLDSGRNPDAVGFPRLTAEDTGDARYINDNLAYRNLLSVGEDHLTMASHYTAAGNKTIRCRTSASLRPRMFFGIFNGASSYLGAFSPGEYHIQKGVLDNTGTELHRYYVMGRSTRSISPYRSSHMLVFEIRYWPKALTRPQLDYNYHQLASTWQFNKYRGL